MPCGDGTGPFWIHEPNFRPNYQNRGYRRRCWQRFPCLEPRTLTKEEKQKILKQELEEIEREKQLIEKQLKETEVE
jgi:hypothetical protein